MPNNLISLSEAIVLTTIFRSENEKILDEQYQGLEMLPVCETFDKEAFEDLLSNPECKGIRIYSGMDIDLKLRFLVVGVNDNDEDIYLQPDPGQPNELFVIENGIRCPTVCPPNSVLNS